MFLFVYSVQDDVCRMFHPGRSSSDPSKDFQNPLSRLAKLHMLSMFYSVFSDHFTPPSQVGVFLLYPRLSVFVFVCVQNNGIQSVTIY